MKDVDKYLRRMKLHCQKQYGWRNIKTEYVFRTHRGDTGWILLGCPTEEKETRSMKSISHELLDELHKLNRADKLRIIQMLVGDLAAEEEVYFTPDATSAVSIVNRLVDGSSLIFLNPILSQKVYLTKLLKTVSFFTSSAPARLATSYLAHWCYLWFSTVLWFWGLCH